MTEEQKKNVARAMLMLVSSCTNEEQLQVLGYAAALKTADLDDRLADDWFTAVGITRAGIRLSASGPGDA
jgi:hypothetical protein